MGGGCASPCAFCIERTPPDLCIDLQKVVALFVKNDTFQAEFGFMSSYAAGVFRGCWGAGNRRGVYGVAAGSAQRARADGGFGVLCAALGPRELRGAHAVVAGLACRVRANGGLRTLCSAGVLGFRGAVLPQLERRQGSALFFPFGKNKQFKLKYSRTGKLRKIRYNTPEREK